jgi:GDP-D-mannose dehydratase
MKRLPLLLVLILCIRSIGTVVLRVDPEYYRPTEVDLLIGDPTKSKHN